MDYRNVYNSFVIDMLCLHFPTVKIKYKDESLFMKILGKLLFFVPTFMTNYTTTIGKTIYFPDKKYVDADYYRALTVITHEFIHVWDEDSKKSLFNLSFLSPQIFAVFSLLSVFSFVSPFFLLSLLSLLFLAPFPSPWRTEWESTAYIMGMLLSSIDQGARYNAREHAEELSGYFTGSAYYYMCPDKDKVVGTLLYKYETLPQTHAGIREVHQWLIAQHR